MIFINKHKVIILRYVNAVVNEFDCAVFKVTKRHHAVLFLHLFKDGFEAQSHFKQLFAESLVLLKSLVFQLNIAV